MDRKKHTLITRQNQEFYWLNCNLPVHVRTFTNHMMFKKSSHVWSLLAWRIKNWLLMLALVIIQTWWTTNIYPSCYVNTCTYLTCNTHVCMVTNVKFRVVWPTETFQIPCMFIYFVKRLLSFLYGMLSMYKYIQHSILVIHF